MKILITENQLNKILIENEFKFTFLKNPEKASNFGSKFGQDVEPSGFFCVKKNNDFNPPNWYSGEAILKNPLYIKVDEDSLITWKYELAKKYKKKKQSLTNQLIKDGYDGIVTLYSDGSTGEIILFKPNESILNKEQLNEGTNRGEVYHYTYGIKDIISSNKMNLSSNLGTSADKFSDKFFFLSLSRTPGVNIGYGRFHRSRLVLDGNKLNQNFKSVPVDYWEDKRGDVDRSEYEDRIISDKPVIDNFNKYIIRIEIVDETPKSKYNYELLQLAKQNNIPIFFYLNKNDLQRQRNSVNNQVENTFGPHEEEYTSTWENNYKDELTKILCIVLYEDGITKNESLLKDKLTKITELYNLPELSLYDITQKMNDIKFSDWRKEEFLNSFSANLHNYFKSGKGDNFREWIKILINEMKRFKVTTVYDLVNIKFHQLKPKGKELDYSKKYSLYEFSGYEEQWVIIDNNEKLENLSLYFQPSRYGGIINDTDTEQYYKIKNGNGTIGEWLNYLLNKYTLDKIKNIVNVASYNKYTEKSEYKLDIIK
jgi:hypothetical protein